MCRCFPLHTKSLVVALTTSVTQSRFTLKRSAGVPVFHSWVLHTAASEQARRGSASKKTDLEKLLNGKRRILRLNIHLLRAVCYTFLAVFCLVVAHSSFFPSLKKMSRVRSSVSALIARQPALIAQAVTSSNLTQAVSPCVRCVPHDRNAFGTSCLFIRQLRDHFGNRSFVMFSSV